MAESLTGLRLRLRALLRRRQLDDDVRDEIAFHMAMREEALGSRAQGAKVQIYADTGEAPTLEVRKLGTLDHEMIGLWVGNNSDGDFSNLRIRVAK
jgi:hypothetical protein